MQLRAEWNDVTRKIDFKYEKVFDLPYLSQMLYDIHIASLQIDLKFLDMFGWIPNIFCKRTIRYHQRNLFKAAKHVRDFVDALDRSVPFFFSNGTASKPMDDREVMKHLALLKKECRARRCEESVLRLFQFIYSKDDSITEDCQFLKAQKEGDRLV